MKEVRNQKQPGLDPDVIAERGTRETALRLLLQLPDEAKFIRNFRRFMIDCGLQVGPDEIARARDLWRAHH